MLARLRLFIAAFLLVVLVLPGAALAMPVRDEIAPGALCVLAFDDANGDGVQGEGEGPVAGVVFAVRDSVHVVATYTTDGQSEPYCFQMLPGEYRVTQLDVPGRGGTGVQSWQVSVSAGTQSSIVYASHAGGGRAPAADLGTTLYGLSGIVCFVAAAAVAVWYFIRYRAK